MRLRSRQNGANGRLGSTGRRGLCGHSMNSDTLIDITEQGLGPDLNVREEMLESATIW